MGVFTNYIEKHCNFPKLIEEKPQPGLKNIIVIPCCNEPDLIKTMESLWKCTSPQFPVEIIVVINSSENANIELLKQNIDTEEELDKWSKDYNKDILKTFKIVINNLPYKIAGVGYARKTGMDEAIRRFTSIEQQNGIISCLDADSTVDENYLVEIEKLFLGKKNCNACSINFEHPLSSEISIEIQKRIIEYEIYLRYYKLSLEYIGFPYYYYTIGSSFAVNPTVYCRVGGMNKKQAGEDFYFLQKVMPLGNYFELNSTTVYPSPRPSDRVPFGTGAFIRQYIESPEKEFTTYQFESFLNLKLLFDDIELYFKADSQTLKNSVLKYHISLQSFLEIYKFEEALQNINSNSSQIISFKKRFFQWFDAFKILKYLNFVHENFYQKELVLDCLKSYFCHTSYNIESNLTAIELLHVLRKEDKNKL